MIFFQIQYKSIIFSKIVAYKLVVITFMFPFPEVAHADSCWVLAPIVESLVMVGPKELVDKFELKYLANFKVIAKFANFT